MLGAVHGSVITKGGTKAGAAPGGSPAGAATVATQTAQAAASSRRVQDVLNSTAQAFAVLRAQQAAANSTGIGGSQAAAAAAALNGPNHLITGSLDVPDGLSTAGAGGLVPQGGLTAATGSSNGTTTYALPTSWTLGTGGGLSQTTSSSSSAVTVTVTQTQPQALLNWQSFNIGKNTTLDFAQSGNSGDPGDWVAINRILDPSLAPSQILGSIESAGQVYVINQNGIIFGGSSQVNVHALVALDVADQ